MEGLIAAGIGILTAGGTWLVLLRRSFPVVLGLTLLTYAVNVFLFASGRLAVGAAPVLGAQASQTDPLSQALVLTAIVISFAMTGVTVILALAAFIATGDDRIDLDGASEEDAP